MLRALLFAGIAILAHPASAQLFVYDCPATEPCPASNGAGTIVSSEQHYNTDTRIYEWIVTFAPHDGKTPDVLWMVINHGPEPQDPNEVAILYADRATGRVTAYVYDPGFGENSWEVAAGFIRSFPSGVLVTDNPDGSVRFTVTIDTSSINSFLSAPGWTGLQFGETIGFWNAGLADAAIVFEPDGRIQSFTFGARSSYDRSDRTTEEEPMAIEAATWTAVKLRYGR